MNRRVSWEKTRIDATPQQDTSTRRELHANKRGNRNANIQAEFWFCYLLSLCNAAPLRVNPFAQELLTSMHIPASSSAFVALPLLRWAALVSKRVSAQLSPCWKRKESRWQTTAFVHLSRTSFGTALGESPLDPALLKCWHRKILFPHLLFE